jgi:hypothetical protein
LPSILTQTINIGAELANHGKIVLTILAQLA